MQKKNSFHKTEVAIMPMIIFLVSGGFVEFAVDVF